MTRKFSVGLMLLLASAVALSADEATHSRWKGVISCVHRDFYNGGYDVGDPKRIDLVNAFLRLQGLPLYDETGLEREAKDLEAFAAGYESCEARWPELKSLALQRGFAVKED